MKDVLISAAVIVGFSLIGGFFAAAETSLVSLRESQVHRLVETKGRRGRRLERLISNPNRFLAAVQVGVTLTGFISAGFGSSRIVPIIAPVLEQIGIPASLAEPLAFVGVTLLITYVSLVIGELVPKRIALQRTESLALSVAAPVDYLASIARPFIWLLSRSTDVLVRVIGLDPSAGRQSMSAEELRGLVAGHASLGHTERALIEDVFDAADRELREVMIPRTEVAFLDAGLVVSRAAKIVMEQPYSRYPVVRGSADDVIGFVHVRDILDPNLARSVRIEQLARPVERLPGSRRVLPALQQMRAGHHHLVIIADEYGGTDGIVTLEDLVEELVGEIRDEYDAAETDAAHQPPAHSGFIDVDGLLNLDEFSERTQVQLPQGPYETVAGYVMAALGRIPQVGDSVEVDDARLTVSQLDGRRASRIRVLRRRIPQNLGEAADPAASRPADEPPTGGTAALPE